MVKYKSRIITYFRGIENEHNICLGNHSRRGEALAGYVHDVATASSIFVTGKFGRTHKGNTILELKRAT
jgi:hypothetical protein